MPLELASEIGKLLIRLSQVSVMDDIEEFKPRMCLNGSRND